MFRPPISSGKSARSAARLGWLRPHPRAKRMNHLFPILTILAYVLSLGLYVRFLSTGRELTGRLGTLLLGLGLITHYVAFWARNDCSGNTNLATWSGGCRPSNCWSG